jgi:hypothetical protein
MTNIARSGDYRTSNPTSIGEPEKVTAWPFPEPDKKSAWQDEAAKPTFELRDTEKDKAEKRTAMIKARMSAPGALRLPELLEAQRLKYGIPDGFFQSQAAFDRVFIFPIDQFDDVSTYSTGGTILRPNLTKLKDMQEGNRGVLISAGLTAADRLMSHGIELGHIVTTNKNVPFARRCDRLEDGTEMFYLVMRDGDLAGSETLASELRAGKKRIMEIGLDEGYQHQVACIGEDGIIDDIKKKKSVWVEDCW